jgi:hypothetical protein
MLWYILSDFGPFCNQMMAGFFPEFIAPAMGRLPCLHNFCFFVEQAGKNAMEMSVMTGIFTLYCGYGTKLHT